MTGAIGASAARMRILSVGVACAGILAAAVAWAAGVDSLLALAIAIVLALLVAATVAWFIYARKPRPALPWYLLLASMATVAAASTLWASAGASDVIAEPSLRDLIYLVGYTLSAIAFLLIARALGAGRDRGEVVDGLILAAGAAVVVWALPANQVAAGRSASPTAWFVVLDLPLIDLAIVAILAILFLRIGRAVAVVGFLGGAVLAQFVGDSLFTFGQVNGDPALESMVLPFSILSSAFLTAALLHPSATILVRDPGRAVPVPPRTRLALISGAAVVAAVVVLLENTRGENAVADLLVDALAGGIVILFAIRAWMLTGQLMRTQADLEENVALLAGVAEAMPGAIIAGDPATMRIDYASPGLVAMLGQTLADVVRPGWLPDHLHPDDTDFIDRSRPAIPDGSTETFQIRLRRADGSYGTFATNRRDVRDADGRVRFIAVVVDVTEQAETAARLARQEAFIAGIARTVRTLIVAGHARVGEPSVLDFVGPSVMEALGYTPEEVMAEPGFIANRLHPGEEPFVETVAAALARGEPVPDVVRRYRAKDGSYRSLLISSSATFEPDGSVRFVASGTDITDRIRLEEELERQRDFIESLLTTTPGMIVRGRILGDRIDYVSPGIREMLGYEPGDVIGAVGWPSAHRHPDDAATTIAAARAAVEVGRSRYTLLERYLAASGEWRWLLEIVNLEDPSDPSSNYVATALDVTDRVRMEEELRAARDEARAADRAKSEFLSVVSHELRTPLNVILGFGELLERADLAAEDRESVEYIVAAGRRLLGLIDRMLDYARLETGRLQVAAQPVLVDDVTRHAIDRVRVLLGDRDATVVRAAGSEDGLLAVGDVGRLTSVVEDLVDNAVRHGGAGVHVTVGTRRASRDRVAISVVDDGVGMTEEQMARVFDPLRRDATGTGATLGLALARRLVEAMGGAISLRSEPGAGTTATLEMPALVEASEPAVERIEQGAR